MAIGSLSRLLMPVQAEHAHSTFRSLFRPSIRSPKRRSGRRCSRSSFLRVVVVDAEVGDLRG
eukprot:11193511-Heterocapsa_arctica.AAC.1